MKTHRCLITIWLTALATMACSSLYALERSAAREKPGMDFFVSLEGKDNWSGRLPAPNTSRTDGPFATLERARDAVRHVKNSNTPISIWIRGGIYPMARTFELSTQDSGTDTAPITYRAWKGETVRLIGGKQLSGFKPVSDPAVLSRLEESARGKVLQADLKAQGITDYGSLTRRGFSMTAPSGIELFYKDKPMTLARWPNNGWALITETPNGQHGGVFGYDGDRPSRWTGEDDIWVHGYWSWDWADSYEKVKSIDTRNKTITTEPPHGVYGYTPGKRYRALNILAELDEPGEWYLDRKTGILYFWPPDSSKTADAVVSITHNLISLKDTSYITIRDITLECCRNQAIIIQGGTRNLVAGCTIRNTGSYGASINGGTQNGFTSCDLYDLGDGGIALSGGDRRSLTPAGNFVKNCHIHHYSRWAKTYVPGVAINGVGNRISNCLIHDAPHNAILLHGNEHIIEFNDIHHVCMETSDAGGFYLGRDWTERGNVVRFNYFHHMGSGDVRSVYLDDWASDVRVYGNIFYKAEMGVCIGGGRDNVVQNNIFVECSPAIHVDARGMNWAKYYFDGSNNTLPDRLNDMNYRNPPYSERYPELLTLYNDEPALPKHNIIERNVCVGRWLKVIDGVESLLIQKDNFFEGNPLFMDAARENFQLREDSPVWKIGFKRIPVEKIGLYRDESATRSGSFGRKSWQVIYQ